MIGTHTAPLVMDSASRVAPARKNGSPTEDAAGELCATLGHSFTRRIPEPVVSGQHPLPVQRQGGLTLLNRARDLSRRCSCELSVHVGANDLQLLRRTCSRRSSYAWIDPPYSYVDLVVIRRRVSHHHRDLDNGPGRISGFDHGTGESGRQQDRASRDR
jgi:hypothetical protein